MKFNQSVYLLFIIIIIISCHTTPENLENDEVLLKVIFRNYREDMFHFDLKDEQNNISGEWCDTVTMDVRSEGIWKNVTFDVIITEHPIRSEFVNEKMEYEIIIDRKKLSCINDSGVLPIINSAEIDFNESPVPRM